MELTHGSLFSGIGGFDLGFERAGFRSVWQVENEPYCQAVLAKRFPEAKRYSDIRSVHGVLAHAKSGLSRQSSERKGGQSAGGRSQEISCCLSTVDIISGGFPCQPFSVAGKRRGKADDRFIWPEMRRVIAEVRPAWVVAENVPGIINTALDQVLSDLEAIGYATGAITVPACAFDAPHRRERVWIVGHARQQSARNSISRTGYQPAQRIPKGIGTETGYRPSDAGQDVADPATTGFQKRRGTPMGNTGQEKPEPQRRSSRQQFVQDESRTAGERWWLPEPSVCELDDGLPSGLVRYHGRVAKAVPHRVQKLKALGNAVVPQITEWLAWKIRKEIEREGTNL